MVFSSLIFLFRFLPAVIILYYIVPQKLKNTVLFFMSLVFYAWGEPVYVCLMLFSTVVDFGHGLLVEHYLKYGRKKRAKLAVVSSVIVNLALLGFFKYANFLIGAVSTVTGWELAPLNLALPIGISFYTFQTMSYTIDVYRGEAKARKNILDFGCYVAMFPQLIAGPIVRFKTIARQLRDREMSATLFSEGLIRFTTGMGKKVLLANNAGLLWDSVLNGEYGIDPLSAWLGIAAFGFQIYFDFSGYSDMAIGLGKMFGFIFPENFDYPYISKSITEFWRRWHISLGQWFREYVYIPLGGNRRHPVQNIAVVWLLTGLWHGANVNFILWGVYYGAFLLIEKFLFQKRMEHWPSWLRHIYTLVIVYFGWMIFACEDMLSFMRLLKAMAGFSEIALPGSGLYLLYTNLILFAVMGIGATPLPARAARRLTERLYAKGRPWLVLAFTILAGAVIWGLCLAYLVDMTYNPFLYFRF